MSLLRWRPVRLSTLLRLVFLTVFVMFLAFPSWFEPLFQPLAGPGRPALYRTTPLWRLTFFHLRLVLVSVGLAGLVGLGLAIWVTRPGGRSALALSRSVVSVAQVFPPVAVLAVLVPVMGFGDGPVVVALFLYGLLPVFETSLSSLSTLSPSVLEASRGCGLTGWQRLVGVELALSAPMIVSGFRVSLVTGLGLAAIGSTVSSRTLGEVIVAGLLSGNGAYVAQGAGLVGGLALAVSWGLRVLARGSERGAA